MRQLFYSMSIKILAILMIFYPLLFPFLCLLTFYLLSISLLISLYSHFPCFNLGFILLSFLLLSFRRIPARKWCKLLSADTAKNNCLYYPFTQQWPIFKYHFMKLQLTIADRSISSLPGHWLRILSYLLLVHSATNFSVTDIHSLSPTLWFPLIWYPANIFNSNASLYLWHSIH